MSLNERIKNFYDKSTPLWLNVWGEHMHHGYYGPDGRAHKGNQEAQVELIEQLLKWGGVDSAESILDAGCGVGGSSRMLAQRFGASAYGLTLSPVQAAEAREYNRQAGLADRVRIDVGDMLMLRPENGRFDLIWSMESAEHVADKARLFRVFHDVLKPGGRLLMATWCARPVPPSLQPEETRLLDALSRYYHLPALAPRNELERLARAAGFKEVETADWTDSVAPFWGAVIRSALSFNSLGGIFQSGWSTIKGAWAMQYMRRGFKMGTLKFSVLKAKRSA